MAAATAHVVADLRERIARSVDASYVTIILTACEAARCAAEDAAAQQLLIHDVRRRLYLDGKAPSPPAKVVVSLSRRADVEAAAQRHDADAADVEYVTDAMLSSMLRNDPLLSDYVAVVTWNVQHKEKLVERLTHAARERGLRRSSRTVVVAELPKLRLVVFDGTDNAPKTATMLVKLFESAGLSTSVVDCCASQQATSKSGDESEEGSGDERGEGSEDESGDEEDDPLDAGDRHGVHSAERNAWAAKWSSFPLYAMKDRLRALTHSFATNQVTIVVSGTGSGKTVLAPPLMLRLLQKRSQEDARQPDDLRPLRVAVTIPKRATVLAAAQTGAKTLDVVLGEEVGYQFRGEKHFDENAKTSALLYATDGTLLARSRRDGDLEEFGAVLVDEAHERPVPTDLLLAVLRSVAAKRPEFRVVVMSATIDPDVFVRYFSSSSVGVVHIAGNPMHPIERRFMFSGDQGPPLEYVKEGIDIVKKILVDEKDKSGNVLVFVPLTKDTTSGCNLLRGLTCSASAVRRQECDGERAAAAAARCVTLYGKMSAEERDAAIGPSSSLEQLLDDDGAESKKVFIATNVAESSLTLPGLTHVVDSGLQLSSSWDAARRCTRIVREMASQAQITQRIGRVGRTEPGVAHLMYSASLLAQQKPYPQPTILTVDMSEYMLSFLGKNPSRKKNKSVDDDDDDDEAQTAGGRRRKKHSQAETRTETQTQAQAQTQAEQEGTPAWFASHMITPPSFEQLSDAVAYLRFYGLIRVVVRDAPRSNGVETAGRHNNLFHLPEQVLFAPTTAYSTTQLGRFVSRVAERLKLSVENALLFTMGVVHGCADGAGKLAVLLETCGGELNTLFQQQPKQQPEFTGKNNGSSDHVSLLHIFEQIEALLFPTSEEEEDHKTLHRTWQTAENELGLSPEPWVNAVRDHRRCVRQIQRLLARDEERVRRLCAPLFRERFALGPGPGRPKTTRDDVSQAAVAARLFNLVAPTGKSGQLRTILCLEPAHCVAKPLAPWLPDVSSSNVAAYEQFVEAMGKRIVSGLTWIEDRQLLMEKLASHRDKLEHCAAAADQMSKHAPT